MISARLQAWRKSAYLAEDLDMVIARFFGCSPFEVGHRWPLAMRERAAAFVDVYSRTRPE